MIVKRILTLGVILLFIGVAVAPSIVVKASPNDDLVEVTTQACGIKGYGNTTVKLTRQQYQNLEEYLIEFRARLNQTSTREDAVPIFKEAVVELDKYGLLPKGMSVVQFQRIAIEELYPTKMLNLAKKSLLIQIPNDVLNIFCLLYANTQWAYEDNIFILIASVIALLGSKYHLNFLYLLSSLLAEFSSDKPLRFMNTVDVGVGVAYSYFTIGLLGVQNGSIDFHKAYGFSGIKIILDYDQQKAIYFGSALEETKFL